MTPENSAKLDEDEQPLDLSIQKVDKIRSQHENSNVWTNIECNEARTNILGLSLIRPAGWKIAESFLAIECQLTMNLQRGIRFGPPVEFLYNPIEYAFEVHSNYVQKYCRTHKKVLFLGMNAGPWGMSQTGVPFGEINAVTNWLGLSGFVGKPLREHPARKVIGFACRRSEVSGRRFWSLFHKVCGTPEIFFRHSFVHNYCPIALMDTAGRNITPAELKGIEQRALQYFCDEALVAVIKLLGIEVIVSVGRFTEERARNVVKCASLSTNVLYIPHPSPRSPSNINWVENTAEKLRELNLLRFFTEGLDFVDSSATP